jgi:hypothetical protein
MKMELLILGITAFFIVNTYYDGKYSKLLLSWKKYYKMAFFGLLGLSLYLMMKRNPKQGKHMLLHANNMIKYLPIDRGTLGVLHPIIDMTTGTKGTRSFMEGYEEYDESSPPAPFFDAPPSPDQLKGMLHRGGRPTKRSVSETKKKYVASCQDWKCGNCGQKLNHTYEVDHKVRLEYGGSNDVDNLVALCRNCHGNKTAMENM